MFRALISGLVVSLALASVAFAQAVPGEKMSHSFRNTTISPGIICTGLQPWPETGWLRSYDPQDFDITGEYQITSIEFAVLAFAGGEDDETEQTVEVIIWEDEDGDYPVESVDLVELLRESVTITDDDSETIFVFELEEPLVLDADTVLAIEIRAPDFTDAVFTDDREFLVATNDLGQHSPSYLVGLGAPCEFTDPLDLTTLETDPDLFFLFGPLHLIIDANFEGGCVPPRSFTCLEEDLTTLLEWENSGVYDTIEVIRDGEVIATLEENEVTYTDEDAGDEQHTYVLTVSQDDFDCTSDSAECSTGFLETCSEPDAEISFVVDPVEDTIDVGIEELINDVEVTMEIDHTWIGDLAITLESPEGTEITLKEAGDRLELRENTDGDLILFKLAGDEDLPQVHYEDISLRWDDEGMSYHQRRLPNGQRVAPEGPGTLADFDLESPEGDWLLTIEDTVDFHDGTLESWCMLIQPIVTTRFLRGDTDGSGRVSAIPDAIFLLRYQFAGGEEPPCFDAADVDGSNTVSGLPDGLYLLRWQFAGGDLIPDPGPDSCGIDPDLDPETDCETQSDCP